MSSAKKSKSKSKSQSSGWDGVTKDGVMVAKKRRLTTVFGGARKGAKQYQEDSFFSWKSSGEKVQVIGVWDGHGGCAGSHASSCARHFTIRFLDNHDEECEKWDVDEWKKQLHELFLNCHAAIKDQFVHEPELISHGAGAAAPHIPAGNGKSKRYMDNKGVVRNANGDPVHGGSTASVAVIVHNDDGTSDVISANVGDSTGLLFTPSTAKSPKFITVDHGPESEAEWRRVNELPDDEYPNKLLFVYDKANVYRKYECPRVFLNNGKKDPKFVQNPWGNGLHPTNVRYEPAVYAVTPRNVSRDTTCIAMVRVIGDTYGFQFGLTCVPDILHHKLAADETYVVLVASDGIWDCWRFEDFSQFLNKHLRKRLAVDQIVDIALQESCGLAISHFGHQHYDDLSLVAAIVQPANANKINSKSK